MILTKKIMKIDTKHLYTFLTLFLIILIDTMGIVLVFPVMTAIFLEPNSSLLPAHLTDLGRALIYGIGLSIFPLFMFFGAPLLGDLSDKFGRKKILLFCLLGTALGYLLSGISIWCNSLSGFLIGRLVCGLMAGSQSIAQAAIADMSTKETKALNMSMIVFASTIGVIIGPIIGGYTSASNIITWFNYSTPFIFAALIALINAVLLICFFKETYQSKVVGPIDALKGLHLFLAAFNNKDIRLMSGFLFCAELAWGLYFQAISWLLLKDFHYSVEKLGLFTGYIGLIACIALTVIIRLMMRWFDTEIRVFCWSVLMMAVANIMCIVYNTSLAHWFWVTFNSIGSALTYSLALALFSNSADKDSQGWIMGVTGSVVAASWFITGITDGLFSYFNIKLAFWTAGVLSIISFMFALFYQRKHVKKV